MRYELDRRQEYRFSTTELGPLARLQLALAEAVIRSEGHDLPNSEPALLAGRMVTAYGFGDLVIYLEVRPPATVSLYLVVDGRNLPEWFVYPTGTWFEKMDLRDEANP